MKKIDKDKILILHNTGKSYKEISKIIGCSKSTVCYYVLNLKNVCNKRQQKNRKKNPLQRKIFDFRFKKAILKINKNKKNRSIKFCMYHKIHAFCTGSQETNNMSFSIKDLLNKIGENPRCALTGRSIDLSNPSSYHLDHIIPRSRGGNNSIENCQILCKEANLMKNNLLTSELIALCREILSFNDNKKQD